MTTTQFQPPSPLGPTIRIDGADHAVNNAPSGGPSREVVHRAISTAYYAVFHASNAEVQHGIPTNAATAHAWTAAYRRMRHGFATGNLRRHLFQLTRDAQLLANHFTNLKNARETADYNPNRLLTIGDAKYRIGGARAAPVVLQSMSAADRRTFSDIALTGTP